MVKILTLTDESKHTLLKHPLGTKKWIEGMRSGRYTQTKGAMIDLSKEGSACCLMVACMVNDGLEWIEGHLGGKPSFIEGMPVWYQSLRAHHSEMSGLPGPATWNDDIGLTFNQIADLLEFGVIEYEH